MVMAIYGLLAGLGVVGVAGPLSDTAGVLLSFFTAITDGKMWRSLGWLLLGLIMMNMGAQLWLRNAI